MRCAVSCIGDCYKSKSEELQKLGWVTHMSLTEPLGCPKFVDTSLPACLVCLADQPPGEVLISSRPQSAAFVNIDIRKLRDSF